MKHVDDPVNEQNTTNWLMYAEYKWTQNGMKSIGTEILTKIHMHL